MVFEIALLVTVGSLCVGFAALIAVIVLGGVRTRRSRSRNWLLVATLLLIAAGLGWFGGCVVMWEPAVIEDLTRRTDMQTLDAHSRPLIAAIEAFETRHGRSPGELAVLVPDWIERIPGTGLREWPKYEYRSDGRTWALQVWIPKFFFDLDGDRRFQFEPDPRRDAALGATMRVGDWVYVPD
jgi:hypothetical protein